MTPVYLNPLPTTSTKDHDHQDHFHLFMINSSPTISSTSTNHAHDPRQTHFTDVDDQHNKVSKSNSKGGSSGSQEPDQLFLAQGNPSINIDVEPARWMSCKVRSVHKTISSSSDGDDDHKASSMKMRQSPQDDLQHSTSTHDHTNHFTNKNSTIIRVCSDCNTTTTPLWRSGPQGPKSLCNACGIRQRKARRAMAEAAAVSGSEPAPAPAMKANYNKEKKARTGLVAAMKKQCKQAPDHSSSNPNKKLFFKDLALRLSNNSTFQRVFPRDEEEAAFLLMELSCGFAHT